MTPHELNRDVKRLWNRHKKFNQVSAEDWDEKEYNAIRSELSRLYYANPDGEYLTFLSFKMMFRLNHTLRVISLHQFYINLQVI